jgi:enoyl-CoA hydratase/carnithine racemase
MTEATAYQDIRIERDGHLALVELCRPPNNFFSLRMIRELGNAFAALGADASCRAIVLAAQGKAFCAGADFGGQADGDQRADPGAPGGLYSEAVRMFRGEKPVVAAIQGAAVGGGLGLALVADFRVTCSDARFSANFNRLGFHPGFGLSVTLPRLVGPQKAAMLLYTGRRITGDEAVAIGLADELVPADRLRDSAIALAREIAVSAPLAVVSTRKTLRTGLADAVQAAVRHEAAEQAWQRKTEDFAEGVAAMAARRPPNFHGR